MSLLFAILLSGCIEPTPSAQAIPEIAIIIDDIGYNRTSGRAAIELPQAYAYAILPFSPHAENLAELANASGKDVMVHLPMEADHDNQFLGPGALRVDMSRDEVKRALDLSLAAVPHAIGVNNHMGSRLTRTTEPMEFLMQALHEHGNYFFVDSRTTSDSVALAAAINVKLASAARNVFIDHDQSRDGIHRELARLIEAAKRRGHALGIAHPHKATIEILREFVPEQYGVHLVPIAQYVAKHDRSRAKIKKPDLGVAPAECGDQGSNTYTAQNPDAQR